MAGLSIARFYQQSFQTHPNLTLAFTGGSLNSLGDFVAQSSQNFLREEHEKRQPYDLARTVRFFIFGFSISPFIGRWNLFLEHRFPLRTRGNSNQVSFGALSKRVAADQLLMAPLGLVYFIGSMGLMESRTKHQIQEKYSNMFGTALLSNWKVWPLAQFVNFRYMPLPYRVPFQSSCGVFWTLYLSILNSAEQKQDKEIAMRRTLDQQ